MSEHIEGLAALYALGALDERERQAVERHAATCATCQAALAQAEDDVTAIAAAQPMLAPPAALHNRIAAIGSPPANVISLAQRRPRKRWLASLSAVAAAIGIALIPTVYLWQQNHAMHQVVVADADAMAQIASSPHRMATFRGEGTDARVMYGNDGSWYVIIVRGARRALDVAWMHDGQNTMLGTARMHGDVAYLYLPKSHRMDQLALMDGNRVVAQAQLTF